MTEDPIRVGDKVEFSVDGDCWAPAIVRDVDMIRLQYAIEREGLPYQYIVTEDMIRKP